MSLTRFQREVCRLLAADHIARGERYVAGGAALNEILHAPRVSHDVDLFHDTREAVALSWDTDRKTLLNAGLDVETIREFPTFIEAEITHAGNGVVLQWVQDSAFRFFPLVEHPDFGLALHPFDLATNKVLALVGRAEVRDWVDIIHCHQNLQPFGYLVWATCGKDPGLSPPFILEQASRSAHYSKQEIDTLAYDGDAPDIGELSRTWRDMLSGATHIIGNLPEDQIGNCVLDQSGNLFKGSPEMLLKALEKQDVYFHEGSICGAWPRMVPSPTP
ncbi:MAG: hypothetical protein ACNA71_02135 [Kiritimatiellia bacterium]